MHEKQCLIPIIMHRNKHEVTTVTSLRRSGGRHGGVPIYSNLVIGRIKSKMSVLLFTIMNTILCTYFVKTMLQVRRVSRGNLVIIFHLSLSKIYVVTLY